jgi:cytochrome P450
MSDTQSPPFPSVALNQCPYPFYDEGRENTPIQAVPESNEFRLFRHEDIAFVLSNEDKFTAYIPAAHTSRGLDYEGAIHVGATDGETHKTDRKLISRPFTPGRLKTYEDTIRQHADQLIDRFIDRGSVELVSEFSNPLPALVISDLMGLDTEGENFVFLQDWNTVFVRAEGAEEEFDRMHAYMAAQLEQRVAQPTDDILSELVQLQIERDGSYDPALTNTLAVEMIAGGVITTGELITNAMRLLTQNAEQAAAVRADHGRIVSMLEETLRVESPVQWRSRYSVEDVEIGGVLVPAGSLVTLMLASGNRDDATFACPAEFHVDRDNLKRHFGFGLGIHFCVGAPLARLEGRIAYEQLLARTADIRLVEGRNDFVNIDSPVFRVPKELHVEFTKA